MVHQPALSSLSMLGSAVRRVLRPDRIARVQAVHPAIDRAVRATQRRLYTRRFFQAGPRRRGSSAGRTFLLFNHCYDLDIDALCAADTPHTLWVLDPFALFV